MSLRVKRGIPVEKTLKILQARYPAEFGTDMHDPFNTLVATLLSAQTTDKQVLKIYPEFRKQFPNAGALAKAPLASIEQAIRTVGLYRTKARNVKALARKLIAEFVGNVPRTMDELTSLPGVGRKTASIVLACCFGIPAIAVDTHVHRVVNRLGWVKAKTPEQTEKALLKLVPENSWIAINQTMVPFGRAVCVARTPKCYACPLVALCNYPHKNLTKPS